MYKMVSNIVNAANTYYLLHERITPQEQAKVFLYPNSSEYQGEDVDGEVRALSEELRHINLEMYLILGKLVRNHILLK